MIETSIHRVTAIRALPVVHLTDETGEPFTLRHLHIDTEKGTVYLMLFGPEGSLRVIDEAAELQA
jgi:hypothetical protein